MEVYNTVIDPKKKKELEELIKTLGSIKGRHTELVSVLIPAGANINLTSRQLEGERSTAENIKSKQTRSNVIDALNMIVRELKNYKQTPQNGFAIFCGNISYFTKFFFVIPVYKTFQFWLLKIQCPDVNILTYSCW